MNDTYCCPNCSAVWEGNTGIAQICRQRTQERDEAIAKLAEVRRLRQESQEAWLERIMDAEKARDEALARCSTLEQECGRLEVQLEFAQRIACRLFAACRECFHRGDGAPAAKAYAEIERPEWLE